MSTDDRDRIFARTKAALQVLASSADLQIQYYPDFVLVADELALDFDDWRRVFLSHFGAELTPEQAEAFNAIDERLRALSRRGRDYDEQFWTDKGLQESAQWASIRRMAKQALDLMGWLMEEPGTNPGVYVRAATWGTSDE